MGCFRSAVWRAGRGGTPYWNKELGDFQARVWFKIPPGGNNGLAIRYPGKGNAAYDGMTEVEKVDWEARYAARITLLRDLVILVRTVGYVFRKPPVY